MKWCLFVVRVVAMLLVFSAAASGFVAAQHSQEQIEMVERKCAERVDEGQRANLAEFELELVMGRNVGYGVLFLFGLLFVWSCVGLVKKGAPTRTAGIVVVSFMGAVICYMAVMNCSYRVRRNRVLAEHGDRIKATAELKAARILFERDDWPRPYTDIVRHLETALKGPVDDEGWAHGVLADCYLFGRGCTRDLEKSRRHAEIAARKDDARGRAVLARLDAGDTEPPLAPAKAILDVAGVDVTAVQQNPRRRFAPLKMTNLFNAAWTAANGDGQIRRVSFAGQFGKGESLTNELARMEGRLAELGRRLDCEPGQSGTSAQGARWWIYRFTQTADWIMTVRLYHGRTQTGEQGPLYVTLDLNGREPDGRYNGSNCRFVQKPLKLTGKD